MVLGLIHTNIKEHVIAIILLHPSEAERKSEAAWSDEKGSALHVNHVHNQMLINQKP